MGNTKGIVVTKNKVESISDFLARGGKITNVPPQQIPMVREVYSPSVVVSPHLMDLEEGSFYFSEAVEKAKGKKYNITSRDKINLSLLPPDLVRDLKLDED
jgi:hypothetical protein